MRFLNLTRRSFLWLLPAALAQAQQTLESALKLPLKKDSIRFAFIGDNGTGELPQIEVARQMIAFRKNFPFDFVLMLGDNIYGSKTAADFKKKFEEPYASLLSGGVTFYASLGNHDHTSERLYKPFNMGGQRYYTFKKGPVQFFALDSNYMDPPQMQWIEQQLSGSTSQWKICFFHHPLYSHGRFHGADVDVRARLEPLLVKYGVDVVFNGHEHVYERLTLQQGIQYFVLGNSGELRPNNLAPSPDTAKGFDTDRTFGLAEISGDELHYQVVSRTGATIDSGIVPKRAKQ